LLGDWGLGIGDWGLGPIPNPQSPIKFLIKYYLNYYKKIYQNLINRQLKENYYN